MFLFKITWELTAKESGIFESKVASYCKAAPFCTPPSQSIFAFPPPLFLWRELASSPSDSNISTHNIRAVLLRIFWFVRKNVLHLPENNQISKQKLIKKSIQHLSAELKFQWFIISKFCFDNLFYRVPYS